MSPAPDHLDRRVRQVRDVDGSPAVVPLTSSTSEPPHVDGPPVDVPPPDPQIVDAVRADVAERDGDVHDLVRAATWRLAPLADPATQQRVIDAALSQMIGLGELDPLLADPDVDEILVSDRRVWVERAGRLTEVSRLTPGTTVEQLVERVLAPLGRRIDTTSPIVDARLADGSRVCAVVPPIAVDGATLSIRRFSHRPRPLSDFTDVDGVELCLDLIARRANVVVTGATSSGKTSLLAALIATVPDGERLIVLEDTTELPCDASHLVRLEARPADAEGVTPVPLDRLVRTALRLRPDRLIVGEVRGDEVLALVQALNTGHDGSFATCHANGPLDALLRLESLILQAAPRWPLDAVRQQLSRSIDAIVHVTRDASRGGRRIDSISEVAASGDDRSGPLVDGPADLVTLGRFDGERFRVEQVPMRSRR